MPREPVRPATEVTLTILPARWLIITRSTACEKRNTPVRFVATIASHSPRGRSSGGERIQRVLTATAHRHVRADPGELDRDRAADPLARPGHDRDAIAERVGREPHLLDDRVRRGHQARDLDLLAIDQGRHPRRDLVLPVVALINQIVEALALGLALEATDPDVDALVLLADEAAEDDHTHLHLERDDLFLHALDPLLLLTGTDMVLPELEDHSGLL